jgi:hypothetical protein
MTSVPVISCTAALAGDAKTNEVITTLKTAVTMIKAMVPSQSAATMKS